MIIVTTNEVPGAHITEVIGQVFGLTVRARNIGSSFGSMVKSVRGGELKGVTQLLHDSRSEALQRLQVEAEALGANAVVAFRFETNEYADSGVEVCAYGTAVVIQGS
ncbi:YbjQ family protein [Tsukamurella tyrosinosolvens]|uniref:YbjQ family protein n=1 Tax=Tsukamurella tyrosinosolvens TaxID=57704 RepID=UPI002DD41BA1|nr:YbjQ family protein [Tsukamurella tyrosinosolvens]MEC4615555.1 YbjQ family protein [Tsukamurella tyrosinosolvens]